MSLNKLPATTIKLISSAQVITSVSSVVKELIENALDAGANYIDVKLEYHGLKKIEVLDNGKGVKTDDAWNMCKKSYTSKINSFDDLSTLGTYGFRGEALNSLCAVAKVSVTTKTESDKFAMTYEFDNNGCVVGSKISHVNKGTIVTIENLFENLPVRKQFISNGRRKGEEIKKVEMTIKMLAVIHPRLRLTLTHNKFAIWQKTSVPNIRLSLMQAVAPTIVKQLVDLKHTSEQVTLYLLVPEKGCNITSTCYKNPGEALFLFVNQRPVRDRNIEKIIHSELFDYFGHDIPSGKHPTCLASITLPPQNLDVNLEPNKTRVLFKDMDEIGAIIKKKMFEYYVGSLAPPQDFLDSIDAEVAKSVEKRKNTDNNLEVLVKIPKLKEGDSKSSNVKINERKFLTSSILVNSNNNDCDFDPDSEPSVPTIRESSERENAIAAFVDGLDKLENRTSAGFNSEMESTCDKSVRDEVSSMEEVTASGISVSVLDPAGDPSSSVEGTAQRLDINQITPSQWSRGDVILNGRTSPAGSYSKIISSCDKSVRDDVSNMEEVNGSCRTIPLADAARKESNSPEEMTAPHLDINNVTLSQWSRGDITLDGSNVQSSTEMPKLNDCLNNAEEKGMRRVKTAGRSNGEELEVTQASERSVTSQMGCKDMAGFTKYATEMSKKIANDGKGLSFGRVASELANNWRKLQDSEKEMYNEKAKIKKSSKERASKGNASMREQLQKFLAKSNEKKVVKKRNYPSAISTDVTICSVRKAIERRVKMSMVVSGLKCIGDLSEDVKCAYSDDGTVYTFSERRLSESLLYYNNLAAMIVPYKVLEKNVPLTHENLGDSLWSVMVTLETAYDIRTGVALISDTRITSNGLRIEKRKELSGSYCYQMTDVPLQIAFIGIDDLKEILTLIDNSPKDLPLEDCRPLKIISYIRAETIRQISKSDFNPKIGNPFEKFQYWMAIIKPKIERCPHQNCIYKIFDVPK